MTATSTLVSRVRSQLLSGQREQHNKLNGALVAGDTSVTFTYDLAGIKPGAVFTVGLERMYVWSVAESTSTATVQRGWEGTTAAAHDSGALVTVDPLFPPDMVLDRINDELRDLSSPSNGLFKVTPVDITYNAGVEGYDLTDTSTIIDIWEVRYKQAGSEKDWPISHHWEWSPSMPTGTFTSGNAIWIKQAEPGQTVRVWCKTPFTALTSLSQDVETVSGLPASAIDIPEIGAVMRLTATRDVKRNLIDSQPNPRRAEEVPPGSMMSTASGLRTLRRDRISAERARLNSLYPHRGR